jgi:hemolysin activation/secretion protein
MKPSIWLALVATCGAATVSAQQPAPSPEYRLPPAPQPEASTLSAEPSVMVRSVRVDGVTALAPEAIVAVTGPYVGRMVSSSELQSLRVALTQLYVDAGYVSSGVLLPDQEVSNGVIVYRAVEGQLERIELVGDPKLADGYVEKRIRRHVDGPLNVAQLQYALRALQQDPNVLSLDASLVPSDVQGNGVLRLEVADQPRFSFGFGADNHSSSSTGAERARLEFTARNLMGRGGVLQLSTGLSEGGDDGSLVFSLPISPKNALMTLYATTSDADIIEQRFNVLDIQSQTEARGLVFSLPVRDRLEGRFAFTLGAESNHSETTLSDMPFSFSPGAQDGVSETAVALAGFDWVKRGSRSVGGIRMTYRNGIDALDATIFEPVTSLDYLFNPTGADGLFNLVQTQASFARRMRGRSEFRLRMTSQLSQDPLMSLEKLAIGGYNTVRGYPENLMVRDNGLAASMELHFPLPGWREGGGARNLTFVPFVDFGRSWDEVDTDPISSTRNTDEANEILSAGLGLLWQPLRGLDAQLFWGDDIDNNFEDNDPRADRDDPDLQDDGIHFSLTYTARW